ncbi:MAG: hypothetical protein BWY43_00084 [candidate division WS2 bacterium ADurb.Bin280]|uniref:Uncharacterized protein n=1 Tax=candidate division WS2 bacterium ADurb.Bin280 TaxID=1852829 RepID=A0A1V5SGD9_9BACT|nr:MAG: hypothetical protein BWY43_00084 [candidate division WS2 bacterium ADurb.Bin280]
MVENFGLLLFTKEEIEKGLFIKSNYENAPLNEKAAIRLKIGASTIENAVSKNYQKTLDAYNKWYDSILKKLGKFKDTASVDIKVIDQNNLAVSDAVIMLGNKALTTDS